MARRSTALLLLAIVASIASAAAEDPFASAAYPVLWRDSADSPLAAEDPFAVAAYPVLWRSSADSPVAGEAPSFKAQDPAAVVLTCRHRSCMYCRDACARRRSTRAARDAVPPEEPLPRRPSSPRNQACRNSPHGDAIRLEVSSRRHPFSLNKLDQILTTFNVAPGSERANQVAATLHTCGEGSSTDPHTCATSQQAEAEFAAKVLGSGNIRRLVTMVHGSNNEPAGQYMVAQNGGVSRIGGADDLVVCHPMPYPYMVRYCHRPAEVEALMVQLSGVDVGGATAVAICHKNTETWDQRYFNMLNADRGEEICHYMPQNYVLWLKM
ncbi:hypothetical protein EJB05_02415, partial [Eragrostis curvula]